MKKRKTYLDRYTHRIGLLLSIGAHQDTAGWDITVYLDCLSETVLEESVFINFYNMHWGKLKLGLWYIKVEWLSLKSLFWPFLQYRFAALLSVQSLTVCGLLRNRETKCWQCLELKRFALSLVLNTIQPWNGISISTWPGYFRLDGWHFFLSQAQIPVYEMHTIRCVRVCTCLGRLMSSGCCSTTPLHCSTIIHPSALIFTCCQDETVGSWTVRSGTEISLTHQVFKSFSQMPQMFEFTKSKK